MDRHPGMVPSGSPSYPLLMLLDVVGPRCLREGQVREVTQTSGRRTSIVPDPEGPSPKLITSSSIFPSTLQPGARMGLPMGRGLYPTVPGCVLVWTQRFPAGLCWPHIVFLTIPGNAVHGAGREKTSH